MWSESTVTAAMDSREPAAGSRTRTTRPQCCILANYDPMPSLKSPNLSVALLLMHYFTLWPWPLTFDLEHLQCIVCDETLHQIWTQSINSRRSYCDFNIWPNDLDRRVMYFARLCNNFHQVDLQQLIRAWIIAFWCWYVMSCCDLGLYPLALKVSGTSSVKWSKSVRNLSEIEQSAAELLMTLHFFFTRYVVLWRLHWPLDLQLLLHFDCHVFNMCTKCERNWITHGWVIDGLARLRRAILGDGAFLHNGSQGWVDPTSPNLARTQGAE